MIGGSAERRWIVAGLCAAVIASLIPCGCCRPVSGTSEAPIRGLDAGETIRVHLKDGRIVEDSFVMVYKGELECKFHSFDLESIRCIDRPEPARIWLGLGILGGLFGLLIYLVSTNVIDIMG